MAVIENVGVVRLGGFEGSNPEILDIYPPLDTTLDKEEAAAFIVKSMPHGVVPGTFTLDKLRSTYILSYTFSLPADHEGVRDDLASISVVVSDKKVNIDQFEHLFKEIIKTFNGDLLKLTKTRLTNMLERIYNGVNNNKKIKVDNVAIDVSGIIKKQKLNIRKKDLKEFKGAF